MLVIVICLQKTCILYLKIVGQHLGEMEDGVLEQNWASFYSKITTFTILQHYWTNQQKRHNPIHRFRMFCPTICLKYNEQPYSKNIIAIDKQQQLHIIQYKNLIKAITQLINLRSIEKRSEFQIIDESSFQQVQSKMLKKNGHLNNSRQVNWV